MSEIGIDRRNGRSEGTVNRSTYQIFRIVQHGFQCLSQLANIRRLVLDFLQLVLLSFDTCIRLASSTLSAKQAGRARLEQDPICLVLGPIMLRGQGGSGSALMSRLVVRPVPSPTWGGRPVLSGPVAERVVRGRGQGGRDDIVRTARRGMVRRDLEALLKQSDILGR